MPEKPVTAMRARRHLLRLGNIAILILLLASVTLVSWYEPDPGPNAPKVLVAIDQSAWNSLGLNQFTYVRALRRQGLSPVLVEYPSDLGALNTLWSERYQGLVLTGGGDVAPERYRGKPELGRGVTTERDEFELALLGLADGQDLPILGLCRGAQLMNVWKGGTLGDHREDRARFKLHRNITSGHAVTFSNPSLLQRIFQTDRLDKITTWHGQFVDEPGREVRITAYAPDGTPEAIELDGPVFRVGVQWHAEMPPWDTRNDALFAAYADAVRQVSTKEANKRR